jgi:hypothetical protein
LIRWGACLVPLAGCETDYQGAPTPCDDWCLVTQRANCEDDWPDNCVQGCARRGNNAMALLCPVEWATLIECHRSTPDSDYYCDPERTRARDGVCEEERKVMLRCGTPDLLGCFEQCDRADRLSLVDGLECYGDCMQLKRVCGQSAVDYFQCVHEQSAAGQASINPLSIADTSCPETSAALVSCLERRDIDVFERDDRDGP